MAAFKILSYDTVKIGSKGTWADELGDAKLRPPELRFLLTDLSSKLQHVLGNTVKKGPFGAGPETASLKSAGFNKIDRMGAEQVWSRIQSDFFKKQSWNNYLLSKVSLLCTVGNSSLLNTTAPSAVIENTQV